MKVNRWQIIIVTLFLLGFITCCKRRPVAEIISTYRSGAVREERYYPDEKNRATYDRIYYYSNGDTFKVNHYLNGVQNGYCIGYSPKGFVKYRLHFVNDFKVDTMFYYTDSGVIQHMTIIKGKCADTISCCDGTHLEFERGRLRFRFYMKEAKADGLHEVFYTDGKISETYTVVNCEWQGPYKSWFENGSEQSEGMYYMDEKEGVWKFWHMDGSREVYTYHAGVLSGPAIEYAADTFSGSHIAKGSYENGKATGRWLFFDKDSILMNECDYLNDKRTGKYTGYHKNGKIRVTGNEINDEWEGRVFRYDSIGKLTENAFYKSGKKVK